MRPDLPHTDLQLPERRRVYLMRHGSVDYFGSDGTAVRPDTVTLNARGRAQADAAGHLFREQGVRFDRVVTSGLARTTETAQRVLAASGHDLPMEPMADLQEIRPGRIADIAREDLLRSFLGAFDQAGEHTRFLGGESVGSMLDRTLPAFDALLREPGWSCLLLVLHGGVNRALLTLALTGRRGFIGGIEQNPACINIIDVAEQHPLHAQAHRQFIVRGVNLAPTEWLHARDRHTTMERLLLDYLRMPSA